MSENADYVVDIYDLAPYSTIELSSEEKEVICESLNTKIESLSTSDSFGAEKRINRCQKLIKKVKNTDGMLRLLIAEHEELRRGLVESETAQLINYRLGKKEPDCGRGCDESGYRNIRINGGPPMVLCSSCIDALNFHKHRILSGKIPFLTEADKISIQNVHFRKYILYDDHPDQTTLPKFATA